MANRVYDDGDSPNTEGNDRSRLPWRRYGKNSGPESINSIREREEDLARHEGMDPTGDSEEDEQERQDRAAERRKRDPYADTKDNIRSREDFLNNLGKRNDSSSPDDTRGQRLAKDFDKKHGVDHGEEKGFFKGVRRNKKRIAAAGGIAGAIVSLSGLLFFSGFGITNFLKNVESKGFLRYQVDLEGRSSKWIQAYMQIRMMEIDDPNVAPRDRDNLMFRANRVDNNKYLTDWYRTMRTSKFEDELFKNDGIRFHSIATWDDNAKVMRFRTGKITFANHDGDVSVDTRAKLGYDVMTKEQFDILAKGDVNGLNGKLGEIADFETHEFSSNKEARKEIRAVLNKRYPGIWKAVKRWHIRKDIQNMIGLRSWTLFEEKRQKLHEKRVSIRNRVIQKAAPEDTKAGKFVQCLFGVTSCRASDDPVSPENRQYNPNTDDGNRDQTDKTEPSDPNDPNSPEVKVGDGSGTATLSDGAAATADAFHKIISKLIGKIGLLSMLDALARFDESIHNHKFSKFVVQSKKAQMIGLATVSMVAGDHFATGRADTQDVNDYMAQNSNYQNSEGWSTLIDPSKQNGGASALASALSTDGPFVAAKNRKEYCSAEHQRMITRPQNRTLAENEYQYLCPSQKIDGPNQAQKLEDDWNSNVGVSILHPLLKEYHAATGGVFDIFNKVIGGAFNAVVSPVISALGLTDDIQHAVAYVGEKALAYGGGTLGVDEHTPSGQVANLSMEGFAALQEGDMREAGAAKTTTVTRALANKNVVAYENRQMNVGFSQRYLALANPNSLLSKELSTFSTIHLGNVSSASTGFFGSAIMAPIRSLFAQPVHASGEDGYAFAKFAGIDNDTYDFPSQCTDTPVVNMTTTNSTNADDIGLVDASELNWDLMYNSDKWYDLLYQKAKDKVGEDKASDLVETVYNCALFDGVSSGGVGTPYGAKGPNAYGSNGNQSSDDTTTSVDSTTTSTVGDINPSDLTKSSTNVACADGSKDNGEADGYSAGNKVRIKLCAIQNLPGDGQESNGGYGIADAGGKTVVNSVVSANFIALVNAAKSDGINLTTSSSFRTMSHQQELWVQYGMDPTFVARPGTSNHQMGLAIDFWMADKRKWTNDHHECVNVGGRCEAPGDKVWEWLNKNASKFGIKPYVNEYWHWSPTGN